MHLRDLADIQTGYPFRGAISSCADDKGMPVFQMGDLGEATKADMADVMRTSLNKVKDNHLLKDGDILFRTRGNWPVGYCVQGITEKCVAAAPLLRIRIKSNVLIPEYLVWYSRQPQAQSYFELNSQGASLRMVGLDVLENWLIPVVPLEQQRQIVELWKLSEKEQRLTKRVLFLKNQILSKTLNKWIGE